MDYRQVLTIAFESLGSHKLRTFLTMLGVIIGVAAVVAMLSIGEGAKQEALEQISILGINNIIINAKVPDQIGREDETAAQRSAGLSLADADNLRQFPDLIQRVVPQRYEPVSSVTYGSHEAQVRVVATTPEFTQTSSIEVQTGRFIVPSDIQSHAQVCILGAKARRALFAFSDPIGQAIRIGDLDFTVVGIMADKYIGRGKVEGLELKNFNEDVYIPLTTAQKKFERTDLASNTRSAGGGGRFMIIQEDNELPYNVSEVDQLTVTVTDLKKVAAATKLVERIMQRRHNSIVDYEIVVPESLLRQTQKTQEIFNLVMGAIAGLSLLVGGIGIMNIMLATVLERTREIGVRRAVGATQVDIMRQFLVEAVTICLIGCGIGLVLGIAISNAISLFAGWPTIVSIFSIVLAIGVSTIVGVSFGLYPARRASQLDVIESLRYE